MKNILRQWKLIPFAILCSAILYMHFSTYGDMPKTSAVTDLQVRLQEQQSIYNHYAPIVQQGEIAKRHLILANKKANILREEIKIAEGFQSGE